MRLPALFVSHGAPSLALDRVKGADLRRLGERLPRPEAILVVSAHWERTPPALGTIRSRPLLCDFGGFSPALREVRYPAPPAGADLIAALREALAAGPGPGLEQLERPWDHGVWVPLLHMFPAAEVPVLQLSLPSQAPPEALLALGRSLAPLRERGVLIVGSGGAVHNLGQLDWRDVSCPPPWALAFEAWLRATLSSGDDEALLRYAEHPSWELAHPSPEHFLPLLVARGAGLADPVGFPLGGFEYGSLSRSAVRFG